VAWIVFNADDFGYTEGVCEGIVEAMEVGVVRSTTAMVCVDGAASRLTRWLPRLGGRVGLHLQLTGGLPCMPSSQVPSLVGEDGRFVRSRSLLGTLEPAQILLEWEAQLERLRSFGVEPTHLDSHHHVHLEPGVFESFCRFARQHGLAGRTRAALTTKALREAEVVCLDRCEPWFEQPSVEQLVQRIDSCARKLPRKTLEIMCHPARVDDALRDGSSYVDAREAELAVLCDPRLREVLDARGHQIGDMASVLARARAMP
jgi:predicted glycoside hydrolase/deacetylase ChbG (UPF0249 family)